MLDKNERSDYRKKMLDKNERSDYRKKYLIRTNVRGIKSVLKEVIKKTI